MLIIPADFNDRPYRIPNQSESPDLAAFLNKEEDRIAVDYLLGFDLFTDFRKAYEASIRPTDPVPLDPKWQTLINGAAYTPYPDSIDGHFYYYTGWVNMIRPALYSLWIPKGAYKLTNVGYVENTPTQQSSLIDNYQFEIESWNDFVNKATGNSFDSYGVYNINAYNYNSFYGFMSANTDDYEGWQFRAPQYKNRFDF
jgi:hypothetical protein